MSERIKLVSLDSISNIYSAKKIVFTPNCVCVNTVFVWTQKDWTTETNWTNFTYYGQTEM